MLNAVIGPPRSDRITYSSGRSLPQNRKGTTKVWVHRDYATAALLGGVITQLNTRTDLTGCVEHHVPRQVRDLASAQAGLRRQQNDHTVAEWMAAAIGEGEQISHVAQSKDFGLFPEHPITLTIKHKRI
jgi:hypothetical protein